MKNLKYILISMFVLSVVYSCQEEDQEFGDVIAPSNIQIDVDIVGADANNPNGDGTGVVNLVATADNAISYQYVYNNSSTPAPNGMKTYTFATLGLNTYSITVIAFGTGGASSSKTIDIDVLSLYEPPADLITMLTADDSRTWRIKNEGTGHFGLGPVGGILNEFYGAAPNDKAGVGMYDDRYIFNVDGTFTHITDSTNDDPTTDESGTIFGREVLINELNGSGNGTANGADIENYPYSDYSAQWAITAPGGVETLSLTGIGFLGYYVGGSHNYIIESRSANEMTVRTTDGNGEFDWGLILTSSDLSEDSDNLLDLTIYDELIWEEEFDTDGAPDPSRWTYDIGTGSNGWGNGESQYYTEREENVIVEGGNLVITAKAESFSGSNYTSARLKSQDLFEFTNGRVEIRAKLPASAGTWPALWMLGANFETVGWPVCGEIDIMEQTGGNKQETSGTLHYPAVSPGTGNTASTTVETATSEFHLYSVEWTPDEILIAVDNEVFHSIPNSAELPFDADFFLILNVAMGGTLGGDIPSDFTEDSMEVDYIRLYQ